MRADRRPAIDGVCVQQEQLGVLRERLGQGVGVAGCEGRVERPQGLADAVSGPLDASQGRLPVQELVGGPGDGRAPAIAGG